MFALIHHLSHPATTRPSYTFILYSHTELDTHYKYIRPYAVQRIIKATHWAAGRRRLQIPRTRPLGICNRA